MKMGFESEKDNRNVYFQARKRASIYSPKLYSREGASELLGVSVSTLADYELGNTKVVPVDKVVLMADLYNCPELKNYYCKHECPIGKDLPLATEQEDIEKIVIRLLKELEPERITGILKHLVDIAADGEVSKNEVGEALSIGKALEAIEEAISGYQLMAKKIGNGEVK